MSLCPNFHLLLQTPAIWVTGRSGNLILADKSAISMFSLQELYVDQDFQHIFRGDTVHRIADYIIHFSLGKRDINL